MRSINYAGRPRADSNRTWQNTALAPNIYSQAIPNLPQYLPSITDQHSLDNSNHNIDKFNCYISQ